MKLRCIIIDDEYLARQRLLKLLENFEDLLVVATCKNGKDALEKITLKEPDLIFLDIQMPDMNGFTVLSKLHLKPHVIFTTAYDTFALKAFEINAVDYLLKPFDEDRLSIAIERIIQLKKRKESSLLEDQIKKLLSTYQSTQTNYLHKITLKTRGKDVTIFIDDVICFKSDGNYVKVITEAKTHLHRITMNTLYKNLDTNQFLRIHRSIVLNKIYIKQCTYVNNNEFRFVLKNGEEYISSRKYSTSITAYLS
ncbi:LytR/AlgR family response regulator transcription factor [Aquimarina algiphila]|uniref:Response regulator transcription factor n=1 Tax=Aquimarina algiphila TaxID=2047982 RepID=A0A554VP66_9FLAO|nr:response regulator transcription factor [Aquimarina algiphila]TSE10202.1 response regulator transcription factor [Aquimarina algiphila]